MIYIIFQPACWLLAYDTLKADPSSLKYFLIFPVMDVLKRENMIFVGNHYITYTGEMLRPGSLEDYISGAPAANKHLLAVSVLNILKKAEMVDPELDHSTVPRQDTLANMV